MDNNLTIIDDHVGEIWTELQIARVLISDVVGDLEFMRNRKNCALPPQSLDSVYYRVIAIIDALGTAEGGAENALAALKTLSEEPPSTGQSTDALEVNV